MHEAKGCAEPAHVVRSHEQRDSMSILRTSSGTIVTCCTPVSGRVKPQKRVLTCGKHTFIRRADPDPSC